MLQPHISFDGLSNPLWLRTQFPNLTANAGEVVTVTRSGTLWRICALMLLAIFCGTLAALVLPQQVRIDAGLVAGTLAFCGVLTATLWPRLASYVLPIYAATAGLFGVGIATQAEQRFAGAAINGLCLTLIDAMLVYGLYQMGLIRSTRKLHTFVLVATTGIALTYLLALTLYLLGVPWVPPWHAGMGAMLWFAFLSAVATLNLVIDIERLEALVGRQVTRERYHLSLLSSMVTLVWLYVSVVRLLSQLRR